MARQQTRPVPHTGQTERGNTRDLKVERVGKVTIYKRGASYYLYYRQNGRTERPKVEGNLLAAKTTAANVAAALAEERPSPLSFQRTEPSSFVAGYLDFIEHVQGLAWRSIDRYRAALDRFVDFCNSVPITAIDHVGQIQVEDFVRCSTSSAC